MSNGIWLAFEQQLMAADLGNLLSPWQKQGEGRLIPLSPREI